MVQVKIEITKDVLRRLIIEHISSVMNGAFIPDRVQIEVKSKQNYKSEWEEADFRAVYMGEV